MSRLKEGLTKKISSTNLFVVIVTKNYLDALRNMDGDILTQIDLAREYKKPFFIVIDRRLSNKEVKEIDEYFANDNIVKRMLINIDNPTSQRDIASEIKIAVKEVSGKDKDIKIITPYE